MRRLVLLGVLALAASPPAATAKEVGSLTLCGTDGCRGVPGEAARRAFTDSGTAARAPARPEPFLRLRVTIRAHEGERIPGFSLRWLPRAGVLRSPDGPDHATWSTPAPALTRALERAARGLRPKPASALGPMRTAPPPRARVDEVFAPGAAQEPDGGPPAPAFVAGAGALVLAAAGLARRTRRRH
jgi:MYXO-CTERM domain-containing protein